MNNFFKMSPFAILLVVSGCESNRSVAGKPIAQKPLNMTHNPYSSGVVPPVQSKNPADPKVAMQVREAFAASNLARERALRQEARGELQEAEATLREAIVRSPKLGTFRSGHIVSSLADPLGRVLVKLGRAKDAITILDDSSKISGDVRQSLGIAYFEAGDLDKAREFYDEQAILLYGPWEQATEDLPGQHGRSELGASLYLARANTFLVSAQLELAEDDLVRAKELCPQNALVLYILGDHYEG
ncbi:MAG: hypothetical protein JNM34_08855, partial [Chthonomonadaceae bacterium]|nr:hypothetical protein [Chthonomonadaceae bacterium]